MGEVTDKGQDYQESAMNLHDLWFIIKRYWPLISITALIGLVIGSIWVMNQEKQYKAQAVIQVKRGNNALNRVGNQDSGSGLGIGIQDNNISNQKVLLTSSVILLPAIKQTQYNIQVKPHYFPIFGSWWASKNDSKTLSSTFLGLSHYAWGGEKLRVKQLHNHTLPIDLTLQAQKNQHYKIYNQHNKQLLGKGQVGETIHFNKPNKGKITLNIKSLRAHPGTQFDVTKKTLLNTMHSVQSAISINSMGSGTNLLSVSLKTHEPQKAKRLLHAIIQIAKQQNKKRKSRQAQKTLDFLEKEIPITKQEFQNAQQRLLKYQAKNGFMDLDQKSQMLLNRMSNFETSINQLQMKKLAAKRLYTDKHPLIQSYNQKIKRYRDQEKQLKEKVKDLPKSDQKAFMFKQDMQVKSQLYSDLVQRVQKLRVMKAATLSDLLTLQNADVEAASNTVNSTMLLLVFMFGGGLLGFMIAAFREIFREQGLRDLDLVDDILGVDHKAVIPFSKRQKQIDRHSKKGLLNHPVLLAKNHPQDGTVEGLRSLKTSLLMSQLRRNDSNSQSESGFLLGLHGITPSSGKSFIAANLSFLLAQSGHRVVLLDADMRRSRVQEILHLDSNSGNLISYLEGKDDEAAIIQNWQGYFDVINAVNRGINDTGTYINSERFNNLLAYLRQHYEFIILDAAPILGVSDGLILAGHADYNLVTIDAMNDNIKELRYGFGIYHKNNCKINGTIINKLDPKQPVISGIRYHSYYEYQKPYHYTGKSN